MNAAAKTIQQYQFFNGRLAKMRLSWRSYLNITLLIIIALSGFAVVYLTNMHRMTLNQLELTEQHSHQLELQWGQLLLEQASLVRASHVEEQAVATLHMVLPVNKKTFVLHGNTTH